MFYERDEPISVLIIEDHLFVREALRGLLETRPDHFQIVGDTGLCADGLRLVKERKPDIVLLDLRLPEAEKGRETIEKGLETISDILAVRPSTHIVVFTECRRPDAVLRAIRAGVKGYLHKDVSRQKMIDSLLGIQNGVAPFDPETLMIILGIIRGEQGRPTRDILLNSLTPRELEVLRLIAESKTNQGIADELVIATSTVKKHVNNIRGKLDLRSRVELKIYYLHNHSYWNTPPLT